MGGDELRGEEVALGLGALDLRVRERYERDLADGEAGLDELIRGLREAAGRAVPQGAE